MENKLVSVCIPTYNGERYLEEALNSVKSQTYKNIEIIVSDDRSTDRTLQICRQFQETTDIPMHIHSHTPAGIGANWNNCITNANGEYIKFLFQDDILEDSCIEKQLNTAVEKKLVAVCSKRLIIDENGLPVTSGDWYSGCYDLQKSFLRLDFQDFHLLEKTDLKNLYPYHLISNIFGEPIAFLFEKRIFDEVGLFSTKYKQILDAEMGYRILKKYPVGIMEEKLFRFRLHDEQESSKNKKRKESLLEDEEFKVFIVKNFYPYLSRSTLKYFLTRRYPNLHKAEQWYQKAKRYIKRII